MLQKMYATFYRKVIAMQIKLTEGTTLENVDGTSVFMDLQGNIAVLNATASAMVRETLEHGEDAKDVLLERYDIDCATLSTEMAKTLHELESYGMIEII